MIFYICSAFAYPRELLFVVPLVVVCCRQLARGSISTVCRDVELCLARIMSSRVASTLLGLSLGRKEPNPIKDPEILQTT
jgi:hypothetical protein